MMGAGTSARTRSSFRCERCKRDLAESELRQLRAGAGFVNVCPTCGDAPRQESSRVARPLPALLAGAFVYPFRGATLLWVAAILVATVVLRFVPIVGGLLAVSAELGFLFAVLRSTAAGQPELNVEAADLADYSLWFGPLLKFFAAFVLSFAPMIAAEIALAAMSSGEAGRSVGWPVYALGFAGMLYFPAALVVAAHADGCLGVLNPAAGVAFIARIPGPYAITVAFLAVAVAAGIGMSALAETIDVPVVGVVARSVAALYAPLVAMRMLGLLMEENAEEL